MDTGEAVDRDVTEGADRRPGRDREMTSLAAPSPPAAPQQWHRGMTVIAAVSLFIGTRALWTATMQTHLPVAVVISACYAGVLVCAVLALTVRTRKTLTWVDAVVLALGVALTLAAYLNDHLGGDEGYLTAKAAHEFLHGRPIYGQPWPSVFHNPRAALTKTMGGGGDDPYGYPPLAVLLTAPLFLVLHGSTAATMADTGALLAGAVALWLMLPPPWRSAATAVCLGFGLLPAYGRTGFPAVMCMALLVPVVTSWPRTGAGGRLGRTGVLRAVCLGAACATHQLAWFIAPFLLVGIFAVRRGDPDNERSSGMAVTARYAGVALATWLAINAYFILQSPTRWLTGILTPITQHAMLRGQGFVGISFYYTAGSSRLSFYSYAALLLLLAMLAASVLFMRRLGPALTVLPWCAFYLGTRSEDGYYLMMTPLWLAAAATVPAGALAQAWQPELAWLRGGRLRAAVGAAMFVPSAIALVVATASPPALRLGVMQVVLKGQHHQPRVAGIEVRAANLTSQSVTPHFTIHVAEATTPYWRVVEGPATLAPGATAHYVLRPANGRGYPVQLQERLLLSAVSDGPLTFSNVVLPLSRR